MIALKLDLLQLSRTHEPSATAHHLISGNKGPCRACVWEQHRSISSTASDISTVAPLPRRNRMERAPDQKSTLNGIRLNLKSVRTCATLASGRPIPNLRSSLITPFCAEHSDCEKASTRTERLLPDPTAPHPSRFHPKREQVSDGSATARDWIRLFSKGYRHISA